MSTIKANKLEHISTSNGGIQLDNAGHVTVDGVQMPTAGALSNRNLIINGAMNVAQRGTSSTSTGYQTVDRFRVEFGGGAVTQTQEDLTTGSPFDAGLNHFLRIQNTTAATGASDYRDINTRFEGQNIRNSGWTYKSSSSYITLSFWARASVAQDYYAFVESRDGTKRIYSFPFTLAANTWTYVTETIPGDSSMQVDNDNGMGVLMGFVPFYGTTYTGSSNTDRTWRNRNASGDYMLDMTNTWANTTNATFDITGVQLEVGEKATPFEHRSYGDELARCQRYYEELPSGGIIYMAHNANYNYGRYAHANVLFKTSKRASPTVTFTTTGNTSTAISSSSSANVSEFGFIVTGLAQADDAYRVSAFTANSEL